MARGKKKSGTTTSNEELLAVRGGWEFIGLPLLKRLEVELCRTDKRPETLWGRRLILRENDAHAAARMAFLVVKMIIDFLTKPGVSSLKPQYNQIEAHLELTKQPLPRRLGMVFEENSAGCDIEQARAALEFLLLGLSTDNAPAEAKEIADRVINYFLYVDPDKADEGPRYMLADRRAHGVPASEFELLGELRRCVLKWQHGFAAAVEIVWVLGPWAFPRNDLKKHIPKVLADALTANVPVTFVSTDHRPASWGDHGTDPLPSAGLDAFVSRHQIGNGMRCHRIGIPADTPAADGVWGVICPYHQQVYARVAAKSDSAWAKETFLYTLRGYDGSDAPPVPLVSRANAFETAAFERLVAEVRAKFPPAPTAG